MAKVLGLGGVFFKAEDPKAVRDWYARVLGFEVHDWGGAIFEAPKGSQATWSPFAADTDYFAPSAAPFMINFIVDDIDGILARAAGESTRLRLLALLAAEELSVLELCRILDQSQPRVSRHLKLLAEAGLVERFPDGAWVFYRLAAKSAGRFLVEQALDLIDDADPVIRLDADKLAAVRAERSMDAQAYFARNAARWNEIRSLYVDEAEVEAAILRATGEGPFDEMVDLGAGAGRMLTLLGKRASNALGLDLSQQMLNIARDEVSKAGLASCELRHGDIFRTGLPGGCADLVTVHQVLHYLSDPANAVAEAARLVAPGGLLLIADFAPHDHEFLREVHQHRRLGFDDSEITPWLRAGGLQLESNIALPPSTGEGLTVKIWTARRPLSVAAERTAA